MPRHTEDEDDDFDENGLIKDGRSVPSPAGLAV